MRRHDPEGGRRTDRGASGVEGIRHPERVVAGLVRHRIPLYGQRNGFQPAAQGQKRRYPPAPQPRRAARLRRGAVREGGESVIRPAPQDDPQLAAGGVRRFRRRRTSLFYSARRAAFGRRTVCTGGGNGKAPGFPVLFSCRSAGGVLLRSRNAQASIFAGLPQ